MLYSFRKCSIYWIYWDSFLWAAIVRLGRSCQQSLPISWVQNRGSHSQSNHFWELSFWGGIPKQSKCLVQSTVKIYLIIMFTSHFLFQKMGKTNTTLPWNDWNAPIRILSCPISSLRPRAPPHNKVSSDPRSVFSGCNAIPGMGTTRQGTITYPIDSKVSFLGGRCKFPEGQWNGMKMKYLNAEPQLRDG